MRTLVPAPVLLVLFLCASLRAAPLASEDTQLLYNPKLEKAVLRAIEESRTSIELQMYRLTNRTVVKALQKASNRKVLVRVILCPSQPDNAWAAKKLKASGAQVLWYPVEEPGQIMHLKLALFDHRLLLFGSANWTYYGLNINREADLLITDPELVSQALDQFEADWRISTQFRP